MKLQRSQIANGVFLNQIETDRFKSDRLEILFSLPTTPQSLANGTLLFNVLRENCADYPTQALLARRLEEIYDTSLSATRSTDGDRLILGMSLDVLDNDYATDGMDILGEALRVLTACLLRPNVTDGAFDAACVKREQKNAADEIAARINNKMRYALLRLRECMFAGEPFALSATEEAIYAITPTSLYRFYKELLRTASVEIFYAGRPHTETLTAFANRLFAEIERDPIPDTKTALHAASAHVQRVTETLPVRQGKLCMGFAGAAPLGDPMYATGILFRTVYGSSPVSKLFMNVREKLSLCYYCHAISLSEKGAMAVSSGVENDKKEQAEQEILAQLAEIQRGNISDEELAIAKKFAISACRTVSDSTGGLIQWYSQRAPIGVSEEPMQMAERLSALTARDVAEYAQRLTLDTVYFLEGSLPTDAEEE